MAGILARQDNLRRYHVSTIHVVVNGAGAQILDVLTPRDRPPPGSRCSLDRVRMS